MRGRIWRDGLLCGATDKRDRDPDGAGRAAAAGADDGAARGNVDFGGGRCMRHRGVDFCGAAGAVVTLWAKGKRSGCVCSGGVAVGVGGTRGKLDSGSSRGCDGTNAGSSTGVSFHITNSPKSSLSLFRGFLGSFSPVKR